MNDQRSIQKDLAILYELALAASNSGDPESNCYSFFRKLITRKSLYSVVYLKWHNPLSNSEAEFTCAIPNNLIDKNISIFYQNQLNI